jgi:HEPN domain-containing protein
MYEAENDLKHARNDLRCSFYSWACFSAQQGAEKALKAVFQKMGAEAWGHSVTWLLEELSIRVKVEEELREMCQELDKAYIPTRYPDALPSGSPSRLYNQNEATRLIGYAQRIIDFCKGLLPQV